MAALLDGMERRGWAPFPFKREEKEPSLRLITYGLLSK